MNRMFSKELRTKLAFIVAFALIVTALPQIPIFAKNEAKGVITATELFMRSGPGTDYKNITKGSEKVVLVKDQQITVLGERNGWYHIRAEYKGETYEGYSLSDWIQLTEGTVNKETSEFKEITPTPTPAPRPKSTGKGRVDADELFIRKGPGTDYDKVLVNGEPAVLVREQIVELYSAKDGWYRISATIGGKEVDGYSLGTFIAVTSGSVSEEKPSTTPTPTATPTATPTPKPTKEPTPTPTEAVTPTPTAVPEETPFPTAPAIPEGTHTDEDGKVVDEEGNEYELVTETFSSKYDIKGAVSVELLNMRKSASFDGDVLGILAKGNIVNLVGTKMSNISVKGETVKARWYKVIANVDGKPVKGYVLSNYIVLDYTDGLVVKTNINKQILRKDASSSTKKVKTSKGSVVKLSAGTEVVILAEKDTDGDKWVKIQVEYNGETITGWIIAGRISFISNASETDFCYYTKKEKAADIIVPDPPVDDNKDGKNAVLNDAAALSLKTDPKYSADVVFTDDKKPVILYSGLAVHVIESVSDEQGNTWCKIEAEFDGKTYTGYINSIYVEAGEGLTPPDTSNGNTTPSVSFEEGLTNEGFPESYKPFLRELHEQYPNWIFKAYQTGLDWDTVIEKESVLGENLIPNTRSVEWKSLEAGAYSWSSDRFTVFDGSSWVTASRAALSYYMDPRNFLGHDTIFQFEVLDYNPSYQTKEGIATIIKNTAMNNASYTYKDDLGVERTISYVDTFLMAAEFSGVSPIHLASRVKQEVTIGSNSMSNSVTGTVSGLENLYNYYNIGAFHSTETGGAIANGLKYAKNGSSSETLNMKCLIPWNNRLRSILGGAFYIGNNYINRGQNTIYLQKFNVTPTSTFNHQYMANVEAPYSEGKRMFNAYENPGEIPIVFSIPVYENMPETPCPVPEKAYNPNNWLSSLNLYDINGDAIKLSPSFNVSKDQEYSAVVSYETTYIKISATTVSSLATVKGEGFEPKVGSNKLIIPVEAQNGDVRQYVINIIRKDKDGGTTVPTPTPDNPNEPTPIVIDVKEVTPDPNDPDDQDQPTPTPFVYG